MQFIEGIYMKKSFCDLEPTLETIKEFKENFFWDICSKTDFSSHFTITFISWKQRTKVFFIAGLVSEALRKLAEDFEKCPLKFGEHSGLVFDSYLRILKRLWNYPERKRVILRTNCTSTYRMSKAGSVFSTNWYVEMQRSTGKRAWRHLSSNLAQKKIPERELRFQSGKSMG